MKRTFMKFLPLAAAVLLATSCGKDDDNSAAVAQVQNQEPVVEEVVGNTVKTITITGKMGKGSLSKVTLDGSNQLKLEDGLYPDVFTFGRDGVDDFYGSIQIVDADDGSYSATLNFPSEKEEQFLDGTYVATQGEPVSELKTGEADRYADLEKAVKASYYEIPFKVSHLYGDEYALETTEDVEEGESTDIMVFIRNAFINAVADRTITFDNSSVEVKNGFYYIVPANKELGSTTTTAGKIYKVKEAPTVPDDCISGVFTVGVDANSKPVKVYFSKGNLQYNGQSFQFAASQIGVDEDGVFDHFGWGMWLDEITDASQITKTNQDNSQYNPSVKDNNFANNKTTVNGAEWFTLSSSQWGYLFNTRGGTDAIRYAKATVCGKTGVILLPDGWSASTTLNNTNTADAAFSSNEINASDWSTLEKAGAVFLPVGGLRQGDNVQNPSNGYYWSSTINSDVKSYDMNFTSAKVAAANARNRYSGLFVRLVQSAQ